MLTIGELARYAGVTVRTVRHYHHLGLLPEPARDELGHRRYDATALLQMQRVTALTDAGVPLRRIPEVLDAEPSERERMLVDLDRELQRRQERLARTRQRLKDLSSDHDLALPPGLAVMTSRQAELGVPAEQLDQERELWMLSSALYPELTARWIAEQTRLLDDPEYATLFREAADAAHWSPDDPRIALLAQRNVAWTLAHMDDYLAWAGSYEQDPRAANLIEAHYRRRYQSAAHRRLQLLVQRGLAEATAGVDAAGASGHIPSEKDASRSALE